ncbi:MAG: glutamate ligase domain-containing protein [Cyclonatronaceae bacterium]
MLRARFEQLMPGLPCYFDGAHNPEAFAQALAEVHRKAGSRKKVLVFSMMRDKLNDEMISMLLQFDEIYYFKTTSERSVAFRELSQLLPNVKRFSDKEWLSLATRLKKVPETLPSASAPAAAKATESVSRSKIPPDTTTPAPPALVLFSGSLYFYDYVTELLARASPEPMRL